MNKDLIEFLESIKIDELSSTPKYRQLVDAVIASISTGVLKIGYMMPSINELSFSADISRLTVEKGYNELRKMGVLAAHQGKGYFIKSTDIQYDYRIFLMFNKLSDHKKIIYDAFVKTMGAKASIDFYIYNNDAKLFCTLLENKKNNPTHFVIIPHFIDGEKSAIQAINALPKSQLILLDKFIPEISGNFGAVYENFSKDIYDALFQLKKPLQKFSKLKLLFPEASYYPKEIVDGFVSFCKSFLFDYAIIDDLSNDEVNIGDVYINLMEDDLFELLEKIEDKKFTIGEDLGIISYNETKAKKFIINGLTTISTDFEKMGRAAAELVLQHSKQHIENPFKLIVRQSLM